MRNRNDSAAYQEKKGEIIIMDICEYCGKKLEQFTNPRNDSLIIYCPNGCDGLADWVADLIQDQIEDDFPGSEEA